jgi:YesN/AraC family two-component response regulator
MHLDDIKKHIIDFYYQLVMDLQFLLEKEKNLEKYRVLPDNLSDGTAETLINFFESRIIEMMHISKKGRKKCKKNLICQVEQMMIENLQENITLKDLSKKVHLHPAYLGQKLFDYWGESFQRRLNRMRIEKAIELLSNEEWNLAIEESAYRVGYKNYITFLKYFKLFYGTIPREYIEKNKN